MHNYNIDFKLYSFISFIEIDRNNDMQKYIVKTMKFDHEMNDPTGRMRDGSEINYFPA